MDQLPRSDEGGYSNNPLFTNNQQYNSYDTLFPSGSDQTSFDAGWGINASNYPPQSRAQNPAAPSWPQSANHLSPAHANADTHAAPYARSLSHSPVPYPQNAFGGYANPQGFQYRQPQYDPALVPQHAFNQSFNYSTNTDYQTPNAGTIAPHALQQDQRSPAFAQSQYNAQPYQTAASGQPRPSKTPVPEVVDQAKLLGAIPRSNNAGRFSIINFDDLAKATTSERMGNFVNVGTEAENWDVNRAALPPYVPRRSRNELRKLAANDPKLLARLGKTGAKKQRVLAAASKPPSGLTKTSLPAAEKIKYEGDSRSEDESSSSESDDDSSYSSDDDTEASPLPVKRPDSPRDGTEYDTIKALWRGKRKALSQDSIRKGLGDFWEIVKTIRDRWKADVAAFQDAETKNRTNELPLLRSRVKDQRDMLETAFKAALKHGHRGILELMSENLPLLYLCYQFLLDRSKVDDYNSALPRLILETISLFTTITEQKLEQTHLVKVLPRYLKKGDAKTQYYARRITTDAAAVSKELNNSPAAKKAQGKENNPSSPATKKPEPEPVAGIKRSASTAGDGQAQKRVATGASKSNGLPTTVKQGATVKKIIPTTDSTKTTSNTTTVPAKPKQAVAKPSGLFSSLQSASKKPGTSTASKTTQSSASATTSKPIEKAAPTLSAANTRAAPASTFSFAETMANLSKPKEEKPVAKPEKQLPQETPEQRAKRLRKESRRHLRVSFKRAEDLVEVREFDHDSDEELGHDANQVRDVGDVGGEGRMFKQQHHMMDLDDEEETVENDGKLIEFTEPVAIDFSVVDEEERKRNYVRFGGLELEPVSPERSVREDHEATTLIVFYADVKDIPSNPREPSDPNNGEPVSSMKLFGPPEEKWSARAKAKNLGHRTQSTVQNSFAAGFDLSKITNAVNNQPYTTQPSFQPPAQAPAPNNETISNILASLKQAQVNRNTPPAPTMGGFGSTFTPPQPSVNAFPTPAPATLPSGQPDLAAILAQIQQNQGNPTQAPAMTGFNFATTSAAQPPTQQQSGLYENPERKQWREAGGNSNNSNESQGKSRRQPTGPNPWYKTKVCKYWQEGRCQKGDACSYKHEDA